MPAQVEQIARGMVARTDHVVDAVIRNLSATLQPLPIARWRGMHRNFCLRRVDYALRLLPRTAQGMRHGGPCIALNFGSMAELASAGSSRLAVDRRHLE